MLNGSPVEFACELHLAAGKRIGDLPETRGASTSVWIASTEARIWRIELWMVEGVEHLSAELNASYLAQAPILHDRGIEVDIVWCSYT